MSRNDATFDAMLQQHAIFTDLRLRRAVHKDAAAIKELAEQSYGAGDEFFLDYDRDPSYERISLQDVRDKLACGVFLVGMEGEVDGIGTCVYVATSSDSSLTEMSVLAVHPSLQGTRISMRVLNAAFAFAHALGYTEVESDVLTCKPWLQRTYEGTGWRLTGEVRPWHRGVHDPCLRPAYRSMAHRMHKMMRHPTVPLHSGSAGGSIRASGTVPRRRAGMGPRASMGAGAAVRVNANHGTLAEQFWDNGFVVVQDLFNADEVAALAAVARRAALADAGEAQDALHSARNEAEHTAALARHNLIVDGADADNRPLPRKLEAPLLRRDVGRHFGRFAGDRRLRSLIEAILSHGDAVPGAASRAANSAEVASCLLLEQCFCKPPGGAAKPLHQDNFFFQIAPADSMVTAWIALHDATEDNGCLHYLEGSHRGGIVPHTGRESHASVTALRDSKGKSWSSSVSNTSKAALSSVCIDERELRGRLRHHRLVPVPVRAGTVVLHHGSTIHCSGPNNADSWRMAYSTHWARSGCTAGSSIFVDCEPLQDALREYERDRDGGSETSITPASNSNSKL